jgi:head-tail adaptor
VSPDGLGGYTEDWTPLTPPTLYVRIDPSTTEERTIGSGVHTRVTHLVRAPYHPQITTATRLVFGSRRLRVVGVRDLGAHHTELVLECDEHEAVS